MQDKQKVTLYLPPELHRKLKISAAVESEPMSALAEKAIWFYLSHPDVVEEVQASQGHNHQVYACPGCESSYIIRDGELKPLAQQAAILLDDEELVSGVASTAPGSNWHQGEEELVPC
ncbi:hypothetical protein ACQ4M4_00095 [Leptolyngbya sp. AN02str]|uniref:hypothetical protein n=1 Tax=Leptolyngbya sp. AN02str TaxID=3423363 RepID=UPI003D31068D